MKSESEYYCILIFLILGNLYLFSEIVSTAHISILFFIIPAAINFSICAVLKVNCSIEEKNEED